MPYNHVILNLVAGSFEEEPNSEFLESPMADGTIEEDFEAALAKGRGGSDALNDRAGSSSGILGNATARGRTEALGTVDFSGYLTLKAREIPNSYNFPLLGKSHNISTVNNIPF